MGRALKKNGKAAKAAGSASTTGCARCCDTDCAFFKYLPCVDDPSPDCPYPPPAYVTTCWRCTAGGGTRDVIQDAQGYCWGRDGDQQYLPRDGATGDPPEGYEWIPDGAVVWAETEGPCLTDCGASACRTFDRFLPARKCRCSRGSGPAVAYFRCSDVSGVPGCIVAQLGQDCYELDRQAPSVPGPVPPASIIPYTPGSPRLTCCQCCSGLVGTPCRADVMEVEQADGCPVVRDRRPVDVCCAVGETVQIGYIHALEHLGLGCPPNVYEHWWQNDESGGTMWYRYREEVGSCRFETREGSSSLSPLFCNTRLRWNFQGLNSPSPASMGLYCTGECPDLFRLRESPAAGTFVGTAYLPPVGGGSCELRHEVSASVIRYSAGGNCGGNCNKLGPADPVVPPPPPMGGDGPESLGFRVTYSKNASGLYQPSVVHPHLPRVIEPTPSVALSRNTNQRRGGCANCGGDGGL